MLSGNGGGAASLDTLLRSIGVPDLYLRNAFRISGLSVDAATGELRRRAQQVRAVQALGGAPATAGPLPPSPAPDLDAVLQALARLRDPLTRLVDEFFWFWPGKDGPDGDPGLDALTAGRVDDAENRWQRIESRSPYALHNLAVLNHVIAIDDELAQPQRKLVGAPRRWREAYRYWIDAWRSDEHWAVFGDRVRRAGHPGLGDWVVSTLRERLPLVLSSVNATIAADSMERGRDEESSQVHWRMAAHHHLPPQLRARALRAATDPLLSRIRTHGDRALAVTRENARAAPAAAERLHDQAAPLLRMVSLSSAPDADNIHDEVARTLLKLAFEYHRATDDWAATLQILRWAQNVARGRAMLQSVRENVQGVEFVLAHGTNVQVRYRKWGFDG
ncbi:hypothetical protein [Virgisporangium aurantiacum]|nr:hypothetical protein [Virgisporangium aurantiacum]